METVALVGIDCDLAKQCCQFAGRLTPYQVHLEEPVLSVRKPRRISKIGTRARGNRRDAGAITFYRRHAAETGHRQFAVQLRQAGPQCKPDCKRRRNNQDERGCPCPNDPAPHVLQPDSVTCTIVMELVPPETPSTSPLVTIT